MSESQRTCWVIPDDHCPICGGTLATDGRNVWCMDVTFDATVDPTARAQNALTAPQEDGRG